MNALSTKHTAEQVPPSLAEQRPQWTDGKASSLWKVTAGEIVVLRPTP